MCKWVVVLLHDPPEIVGPFSSEDECYAAASKLSREPNDWVPRPVVPLRAMLDEIELINRPLPS